MRQFTLHRKEKIKGVKIVRELFEQPNSVTTFPLKAFYFFKSSEENKQIKFGVSVSKRKFKKAVDRNKVKRIVREAYRLSKQNWEAENKFIGQLSIMIIYIGEDIPRVDVVTEKLDKLFIKLTKKIEVSC